MKKQTAAVMSAVTLISSVNVPIAPVFAMENEGETTEVLQETVEDLVETEEFQQEEDAVTETLEQEAVSEEAEDTEVEVTDTLKEDVVLQDNTQPEEVTQTTGQVEETIETPEEVEEVTEEDELEVNIPDANLKAAIIEALADLETLVDGEITRVNLEKLTSLECNWGNITDLTGLEYAINLTSLDLSFNEISDLTPLSDLTNLTSLELEYNQISDITPLQSLTNLTDLSLFVNQVSDITPLQSLTNLTHLDLGCNQISDIIPLQSLTSLTDLELGYNQISDITPLTDLTNLTSLALTYNEISDITLLSNLTNLTELYLGINQISDITPLSNLINLTDLILMGNQISDINHLSNLTNLTVLYINDNEVSDLTPLSNLLKLEYLAVPGNHILDFSPLENLSVYIWADNQTANLDPVYALKGGRAKIANPINAPMFGLDFEHADEESNTYLEMENGYYDAKTNSFIFENVTNTELQLSFSNSKYRGGNFGVYSGTLTIPVIFFEVADGFSNFVSNDIFKVVEAGAELGDLIVLQLAEGTNLDAFKGLLDEYSDYELTVTKKEETARARSVFETYILTFTKGDEKVTFELQVPSTETAIINYLEELMNPKADTTTSTQKPTTTGTTTTSTPTTTGATQTTTSTKPTVTLTSTSKPQTGFSGVMGMLGLGTVVTGIFNMKRKKK